MINKKYIGSTTYVSDASRLTDAYGYNGDVAYVIDEFTKKVLSEYTKYNVVIGTKFKVMMAS